jgi:LemA protein
MALVLVLTLVVALGLGLIGLYNRLVQLNVQADNAWADIDVQLKRRHDLIPNLVRTVEGYASHEQESLRAVIEARGAAIAARGLARKQQAERELGASIEGVFALAEAYPALRAVEGFRALQEDLGRIENDLQSARRYYNAVVRDLNTAIAQVPANLVASALAMGPRSFFALNDSAEGAVPRVEFHG